MDCIQVISNIPVNSYIQSYESHLQKSFPDLFPWGWIQNENINNKIGHGIDFMIKRVLNDGSINRKLQNNDILLSLLFSEKRSVAFHLRNYSYFLCSYKTIEIYHKKYLNHFLKYLDNFEIKEWINFDTNCDILIDYCLKGDELNQLSLLYYINYCSKENKQNIENEISFKTNHPEYNNKIQILNLNNNQYPIFIDSNTVPKLNNASNITELSEEFKLFFCIFFISWNNFEDVFLNINNNELCWNQIQFLLDDYTNETNLEIKFMKTIFQNMIIYETAFNNCKKYESGKYNIQPG